MGVVGVVLWGGGGGERGGRGGCGGGRGGIGGRGGVWRECLLASTSGVKGGMASGGISTSLNQACHKTYMHGIENCPKVQCKNRLF